MKYVTDQTNPHLGGNIHYGDPSTFCPQVWDYIIQRFAIKSVLDLGSGEGYSAAYFHSKGLITIATDGLLQNYQNSVYPTVLFDLTKGAFVCNVDLVHCQEVVEHIEEIYIENLLLSLTCGKILLMTHALPGQGGYHHVNEQPYEYWAQKLAEKGFELFVEETNHIRKISSLAGYPFFARSGLLFVKKRF